jgi:hypothetical protein
MKSLALVLLFITISGIFQVVYGQDILLSTKQNEYYFNTGENAQIPIQINNTYGKQISGLLQYSVTQLINQGNLQLSSSNTEKKSISINEGADNVSLGVGKSDTPSNFTVNLNLNYNENGDRVVSLGPIVIHFVSDPQKNNSQINSIQSSSKPYTQSKQQDLFTQQQQEMEQNLNKLLGNQQDLFTQQQQEMQRNLNELLGKQLNSSQHQQQQLQNNQLPQDTNSLKRQLEEQVQKHEEIKKEFEKKLLSDKNFLNRHEMLLSNGYNISNSTVNPISNDTGTFDIKYNNTNGKWAKLEGNMKNGIITEIEQQTQDKQEKLLEKLRHNLLYQQFNHKLVTEGFSQNNITFDGKGNETTILLKYENQKNNDAKITADFVNDEIKQVRLEDGNQPSNLMLLMIISVIILFAVIIFFVIKKFQNKKRSIINNSPPIPNLDSSDYSQESKILLDKAIKYYDKGDYKEAFGTAGKSIRLFLRHKSGIKGEITNEELIRLIQNHNYPLNDIKQCLKIIELVEFANSKANDDDFRKIILLFNTLSNTQNFSKE